MNWLSSRLAEILSTGSNGMMKLRRRSSLALALFVFSVSILFLLSNVSLHFLWKNTGKRDIRTLDERQTIRSYTECTLFRMGEATEGAETYKRNTTAHGERSIRRNNSHTTARDKVGVQYKNVPNPENKTVSDLHTHEYAFLTNEPNLCKDAEGQLEPVYLLILMTSSVRHFNQRVLQRKTCLRLSEKTNKTIRTIFIVGTNSIYHNRVIEESAKYRDVVSQDFYDSYRNLTIKTITALKWAVKYCPKATWVMKIDDDVFLNLLHVVDELELFFRPKNLIIGSVLSGTSPIREVRSKWYISEQEYPKNYFPDYPCGMCYILTGELLPLLVREAEFFPYIFLEDVFVGGILAAKLNIQLFDSPKMVREHSSPDLCFVHDKAAVHLEFGALLRSLWPKQLAYFAGNITCTN